MANQRGEKAKLQSQTEYPGTKRDHTLRARMNLVKKNTHTHKHLRSINGINLI